jgi:hypothetical protein
MGVVANYFSLMLICSREEIKEEFATFGAIVVEQGRH